SFYVDRFPGKALNFNNKKMAGYFTRQEWTTLLLPSSYKESLPDDYPLEKGYFGKWRQFPYRLSQLFNQTGNYKVLKTTPYGNAVVNEFAMALIGSEKLGRDEVPDLLALSFSSMDYENGSFGPLSVEMEDTYLRLDKEIGMLLDFLDKQVGENRYLVVLTSACSSSYPVGYLKEAFNMPVGYVAPESMVALLKSFLNISYGQGDWVVFSSGHQIYLNRPLIEKKGIRLDDIQSRAAGFINQFEGVRLSVPAFDFIRVDHVKSQLAMISGSYNLKRSGDVLYTLEEGWQPRYRYRKPDYTDQMRIPLIWYGPRIKPGKSRVPAEAVDMAPTVFELLGIEPPFSFDGRILVEILAD
ncbi:MAG: alkaline phosphatase family protein, partial [Mangrovibacterium sp.]